MVDRHALEEEGSSTYDDDGRFNAQPLLLVTPPTPSIVIDDPDGSQATVMSELTTNAGENANLPLTAKNLSTVPIAERLKTPHERANDEVVAGMRVLQEQLKMIRKRLVDERVMECELETGLDA
jgi:hypothetical protein